MLNTQNFDPVQAQRTFILNHHHRPARSVILIPVLTSRSRISQLIWAHSQSARIEQEARNSRGGRRGVEETSWAVIRRCFRYYFRTTTPQRKDRDDERDREKEGRGKGRERGGGGEERKCSSWFRLLQIAVWVQRTCCLLHSGFKARSVQRVLHLPCLPARIHLPSRASHPRHASLR